MQGQWTEQQRQFIEWLAIPRFERVPPTQEMMAQQLGVDNATLWRWKKLDGFLDEVNKLARQSVRASLPAVYGALIRQAEAGEYQHIKLLLEIAGEYVPVQKNQNEQSGEVTYRFMWVDSGDEDG